MNSRHYCAARLTPPATLRAVIFDAMEDSKKWQVKEGALALLSSLARVAPAQARRHGTHQQQQQQQQQQWDAPAATAWPHVASSC
jgi:hypothetical protein